MEIRRALITGPTGGVGINLIEELVAADVMVTAVCRPESTRIAEIPKSSFVNVIMCPSDALLTLPRLCGQTYDAFFHFAWGGTSGPAREDLALQMKNVVYTVDAVRAANELDCKVFVGAGSQAEYGPVDGILTPGTVCKPVTGYGAAKLSAGVMSRVLCKQYGIRHQWCRILSMYGPYDGSKTMVSSVIRTLLNRETPKCTKGDQIWDYMYAKDLARAFRLVAEKGRDGAIYCMGSGKSRRLREYIEMIRDAVDPSLSVDFGAISYYPNQMMRLEADISDLLQDVGFTPEFSFEKGIRETVAWQRKNEQ